MHDACAAGLATLLLAGLAGCHLVDQRDFDAKAGSPPAPPVAAAPAPAAPSLVTIRYATPDPQYREALAGAVQRALARRRDVLFVVTTLVPASPSASAQGAGSPSPDAQAEQAAAASAQGREVAQAIVEAGAEPGQVEQAVRVQPGLAVKEVRVSVQ